LTRNIRTGTAELEISRSGDEEIVEWCRRTTSLARDLENMLLDWNAESVALSSVAPRPGVSPAPSSSLLARGAIVARRTCQCGSASVG